MVVFVIPKINVDLKDVFKPWIRIKDRLKCRISSEGYGEN